MNVPAGTDAFMFDPIIWANVWVWCLLYIIMYVESENVWSEYVEIGIRVNLRLSLFKSSSLFTRIIIQLKKKLSIFSLMVKTEIFEIPNNGSIPLRCFVKNKVT